MEKLDAHTQKLIAICKLRYNHNKYSNRIEAIKAYLVNSFGIEERYINSETILGELGAVFEELQITHKYYSILHDLFHEELWGKKNIEFTEILEKMITGIQQVKVKDSDGNWLIDISEIDDIQEIV